MHDLAALMAAQTKAITELTAAVIKGAGTTPEVDAASAALQAAIAALLAAVTPLLPP